MGEGVEEAFYLRHGEEPGSFEVFCAVKKGVEEVCDFFMIVLFEAFGDSVFEKRVNVLIADDHGFFVWTGFDDVFAGLPDCLSYCFAVFVVK